MRVAPPDFAQTVPEDGKAHVVFLRSTSFGGAVQAPVIEAEDGQLIFVAVVSANTKVLHETTPGEHTYVVGGEDSNLLKADFEAGKVYYVKVEPHFGLWKARFTLDPVTAQQAVSPEFKKDFDRCKWYENGPDTQKWFQDNIQSLRSKYEQSLKEYNAAAVESRPVIKPGYGIVNPLP
jgi:hypothetical protein